MSEDTQGLSEENRALVERDLGQSYWEPNDGYVWLSAASERDLNRLLNAARTEPREEARPVVEARSKQEWIDLLFEVQTGKRSCRNMADLILAALSQHKGSKKLLVTSRTEPEEDFSFVWCSSCECKESCEANDDCAKRR